MRVAAAGKKTLRQGDEAGAVGRSLVGLQDHGFAKRILDADASRAREHESFLRWAILAKSVVAGILKEDAAEIGFRTEVARGYSGVERGVSALGGFKRAVAAIANEGEG